MIVKLEEAETTLAQLVRRALGGDELREEGFGLSRRRQRCPATTTIRGTGS